MCGNDRRREQVRDFRCTRVVPNFPSTGSKTSSVIMWKQKEEGMTMRRPACSRRLVTMIIGPVALTLSMGGAAPASADTNPTQPRSEGTRPEAFEGNPGRGITAP